MQGCLLSSFLLSIVMMCFIVEANARVEDHLGMIAAKKVMTYSIIFADDLLILEIDA